MPGEMIGEYTKHELSLMSREDFEAAQAREWVRPDGETEFGLPPRVETVKTVLDAAEPVSAPRSDVWASNAKPDKVFTCPSGQTCRLRKLEPFKLMQVGILDSVTRLDGLANALVEAAEGLPPTADKMPSQEDFQLLEETINKLVPLAVLEPQVWELPSEGAERVEGRIYVDSIDLDDRVAIMEFSLRGLRALDRFRNPR